MNGHFIFEGIGSANIRLDLPVLVAFIPEIWAGTFPKDVPMQVDPVCTYRPTATIHGGSVLPTPFLQASLSPNTLSPTSYGTHRSLTPPPARFMREIRGPTHTSGCQQLPCCTSGDFGSWGHAFSAWPSRVNRPELFRAGRAWRSAIHPLRILG